MYAPLTESESKSGNVSEAALHHTQPCDFLALNVQSAHMSHDFFYLVS